MSKKVALLLSGCGVLDGSEVSESICSILSIEQQGFSWNAFSLDEDQKRTISHSSKKELSEKRNMMAESGRISRTKIENVENLNVNDYDVLWLPGGFGVASSFSNLSDKGIQAEVHPKIEKVIQAFYGKGKIIVGVCIAPALIARVLFDKGLTLTLGSSDAYIEELKGFGITVVKKASKDYIFDPKNNIYSTPAFMNEDSTCSELYEGCLKVAKHIHSR